MSQLSGKLRKNFFESNTDSNTKSKTKQKKKYLQFSQTLVNFLSNKDSAFSQMSCLVTQMTHYPTYFVKFQQSAFVRLKVLFETKKGQKQYNSQSLLR